MQTPIFSQENQIFIHKSVPLSAQKSLNNTPYIYKKNLP